MLLDPKRSVSRSLCSLLAALMVVGPTAPQVFAQEGAKEIDATYVAPNAVAAAVVRPRQILESDFAQMWPVEVFSAAIVKVYGHDILDVESVLVTIAPPFGPQPEVAAVFNLSSEMDLNRLSSNMRDQLEEAVIGGKSYLKNKNPMLPSVYQPRPDQIVIAADHTMQRFLQEGYEPQQRGQVHVWLSQGSADDVAVIADIELLRPLIQMGMAAASQETPSEFQKFLEFPELLRRMEARLCITGAGLLDLTVDSNNEADADRVEALIDEAIELFNADVAAKANKLLERDNPVEQALGRYQLRVAPMFAESLRPQRDGKRFTLLTTEGEGNSEVSQHLLSVATVGFVVALVLPAVQATRMAAQKNASLNNLKHIMLALHNYADRHGDRFPAHANYSEDGKPLLSWRVHILPELEEGALYKRFRLDEPWDSPHNKKLIPLMPEVLLAPGSRLDASEGRTHYLGSFGENAVFSGSEKGTPFDSLMREGTSNTISVLEVSDTRAAIWTKPVDWEFNPKKPFDGLSLYPGGFHAGFADGWARWLPTTIDAEILRAMITANGGEVIDGYW